LSIQSSVRSPRVTDVLQLPLIGSPRALVAVNPVPSAIQRCSVPQRLRKPRGKLGDLQGRETNFNSTFEPVAKQDSISVSQDPCFQPEYSIPTIPRTISRFSSYRLCISMRKCLRISVRSYTRPAKVKSPVFQATVVVVGKDGNKLLPHSARKNVQTLADIGFLSTTQSPERLSSSDSTRAGNLAAFNRSRRQ
jgi:hypothetical protein